MFYLGSHPYLPASKGNYRKKKGEKMYLLCLIITIASNLRGTVKLRGMVVRCICYRNTCYTYTSRN